ncbi:hypothetical protein HZS_3317 [Henneguya salminicola]|nr:hypothetical protein HZS_3317 [Henneguya salminicola]
MSKDYISFNPKLFKEEELSYIKFVYENPQRANYYQQIIEHAVEEESTSYPELKQKLIRNKYKNYDLSSKNLQVTEAIETFHKLDNQIEITFEQNYRWLIH